MNWKWKGEELRPIRGFSASEWRVYLDGEGSMGGRGMCGFEEGN